MRTITIRQFQRQFYGELKDVPFIVTRRAPGNTQEPVLIVVAYTQDSPLLKPQQEEQSEISQKTEDHSPQEQNTPPVAQPQERETTLAQEMAQQEQPRGLMRKLFGQK